MAELVGPGASDDPQRLQREARRYAALLSAEGSIVWVVDPALQPTGRNAGWEEYTGQAPEEYARLGWLAAIHPDERDRLRADAARAMAAGEPISLKLRVRRADGVYRRHLIRAMPIYEGGTIVEWIGTAADVEDLQVAADEQRDLRARLLALTEGAESLLSTRSQEAARAGVIALAQRVFTADAYGLWALSPARREWRIVHSEGLSDSYAAQRITGDLVAFSAPQAIDDTLTDERASGRQAAHQAEGIRSMLTVPLPVGGERRASLVIYFRTPHQFTETELRVSIALGQLTAAALWNAETYDALHRSRLLAERHAARMAFLADASALFGSLDYEATLREMARLAVPRIADWCAVDIGQPDGSLQHIVTAHVDPEKLELARTLQQRYPPDPAGADRTCQRAAHRQAGVSSTDHRPDAGARGAGSGAPRAAPRARAPFDAARAAQRPRPHARGDHLRALRPPEPDVRR